MFNIFVNDLRLKVKNNNKNRTVMKFISGTGLEMFLYPGRPRSDKDGLRRDVSEKQHQNYSVGKMHYPLYQNSVPRTKQIFSKVDRPAVHS